MAARGLAGPAGAALLAVVVAGCGVDDDGVCTLIGAESGVSVRWEPADFPEAVRARVCVAGACEERELAPGQEVAPLTGPLPRGSRDAPVRVRFTLWDGRGAGGEVLLDARTTARPHKSQPNGEDCPPTVWQAGFTAEPGRGLVGR